MLTTPFVLATSAMWPILAGAGVQDAPTATKERVAQSAASGERSLSGPEIEEIHIRPQADPKPEPAPPTPEPWTVVVPFAGEGQRSAVFRQNTAIPDDIELGPAVDRITGRTGDPRDEERVQKVRSKGAWAVFADPARFQTSYDPRCATGHPRDTAMIYEGMTLGVAIDGRYEVRYVLEAPLTPVRLFLQLQLSHEDGRPIGTITLPPVAVPSKAIVPRDPESPQPRSQTWLVRQAGYSFHLSNYLSGRATDATRLSNIGMIRLSRSGRAQFGGVPEPNRMISVDPANVPAPPSPTDSSFPTGLEGPNGSFSAIHR